MTLCMQKANWQLIYFYLKYLLINDNQAYTIMSRTAKLHKRTLREREREPSAITHTKRHSNKLF